MTILAADQFYQVSFTVENVGKKVEKSKKRVTWVFGQGDREHTVTFLWSKRSGKRFVYMADAEVFFETKNTVTFFHKWTSHDGQTNLHILATSATPSKKFVGPNFLKYELIINGQRFVKLPKKDGTLAPEEGEDERHKGPGSIFDIMFPNGYRDTLLKSEGAYKKRSSMTKEVNRRIIKQANYNAQTAA